MSYNGWTNYETWTVALFIDNESNECIRGAVTAALQDFYGDVLKDYVEEYFLTDPETGRQGGNLFVQQMVGAAMSEVNWRELRDGYAEQADEWGIVQCPECKHVQFIDDGSACENCAARMNGDSDEDADDE